MNLLVMISYGVRSDGPSIFSKNGESYILLDGKALVIFKQIRKYHALCLPFLRVLANYYLKLWANQNHILKR